jgi:small subunit ribosomal protein S2
MSINISLEKLIETGAHFGHQSKRWNPKIAPYIYGNQDGIHVFDLIKTKMCLEEVLEHLSKSKAEGKKILLLGTKKQVKEKIEEVALAAGVYFVNERWLGGTFTNFPQIQKSVRNLTEMKKKLAEGEYKDRTKKERLLIGREIARLERFFGGIVGMDNVPDVLFIIDIKREISALKEAKAKNVETIGIVDSNSDPTLVDYPIPMNDDATKALDYVLDLVKEALIAKPAAKKAKAKSDDKKDKKGKKEKTTDKKTKK